MRSIAIMNQKGGVGKTTTAVNISAALAETGMRVCLVDMDPQAHATLHFGIEPQIATPSIYTVLTGDSSLAEVRQQVNDRLWLVPSHLDLAGAEVELAGVVGREFILRDKLNEETEPFDYLIIDCPPSLGVLTINALVAVDEVFIPLQPHFLALHGLSKLLQTLQLVSRRLNSRLKLSGIVLCMYDAGTRLAAEVSQDVGEFFQENFHGETPWASAQVFTRESAAKYGSPRPPVWSVDFRVRSAFHGAPTIAACQEILASQSPTSRWLLIHLYNGLTSQQLALWFPSLVTNPLTRAACPTARERRLGRQHLDSWLRITFSLTVGADGHAFALS